MSTWEERMSARAQERIRAERERVDARIRAEMEAGQAELEERWRPVREAGPPGGCHECWSWLPHYHGPMWVHGESLQPGPPPDDLEAGSALLDTPDTDWCWHSCHEGKPMFCAPVAFAGMAEPGEASKI